MENKDISLITTSKSTPTHISKPSSKSLIKTLSKTSLSVSALSASSASSESSPIYKSTSVINNIINEGKVILDENDFFNDLDKLMGNCEFKNFYKKYFTDYTDIKIAILYMKLYETLQIEYKIKNGCDIEKEVLAYIMKELMSNNETRKNIIDAFNDYIENNNKKSKKYILDIFQI